MHHEIKNQHDKHIIEDDIRKCIISTIEHDMVYTYYEGVKIEIVSHFVDHDGSKKTIVNVG